MLWSTYAPSAVPMFCPWDTFRLTKDQNKNDQDAFNKEVRTREEQDSSGWVQGRGEQGEGPAAGTLWPVAAAYNCFLCFEKGLYQKLL